ncbi:MAG: hypothetical protein HC822_17400 [Oscillochloris sp.]|nr:hypothetical protein [Oscillochloris sp.]
MGSWNELDAVYPPGVLTPAAALITALGHVSGANCVYADKGGSAAFIPYAELDGILPDTLARAAHFLALPLTDFLPLLRDCLTPPLRLRLLALVFDRAYGAGAAQALWVAETIAADLELPPVEVESLRRAFRLRHDLAGFAV